MTTEEFTYGATLRFSAAFRNTSGTLTNPTTVKLIVENPSGTETEYTDATNDSTGLYHRDVQCSAAGLWAWRWVATGTVAQVDEAEFRILPSRFA